MGNPFAGPLAWQCLCMVEAEARTAAASLTRLVRRTHPGTTPFCAACMTQRPRGDA